MKFGSYIYFNANLKKIIFLDKSCSHRGEKIGKVSKSYIKDGKIWVEITIDPKKAKEIRKKLGLQNERR